MYFNDVAQQYNYDYGSSDLTLHYNDVGAAREYVGGGLNSLFLGVFITLVPKVSIHPGYQFSSLFHVQVLPRMMPVFLSNSSPEMKAKFDTPDFVENNEEMLKEEFSKYFEV